jgi:NAD(P)H-hydrate epimerase
VEIWLSREPAAHHGIAERQRRILAALALPVVSPHPDPHLPPADLLVDALIGFSLTGAPTGVTAGLIRAANAHGAPILAVDLPSGLDATAGTVADPTIRAAATLTLALPKTGLLEPAARSVVGDLHVADIGVPAEVYARLGMQVPPIFGAQEIIRIA